MSNTKCFWCGSSAHTENECPKFKTKERPKDPKSRRATRPSWSRKGWKPKSGLLSGI